MLLSQKIYELRKERNLSLQALHLQTGIALASLSAYEKGNYTPSLENLCRLARFYDVSLDDLLEADMQLKMLPKDADSQTADVVLNTGSRQRLRT